MIKTHKELAKLIEGKRILHLNSLGKDSVLALEWLVSYAKPDSITSVHFGFRGAHPDDNRYLDYLRKRYPNVNFIVEPNSIELTHESLGIYQTPVFVNKVANHFEYVEFERGKQIAELKQEWHCDYVCDGSSKYESFARRTKFHQKGLEFKGFIYPLGMMSRAEVISLIGKCGIKLHPCYKFSKGTFDHPSYFKMRSAYITNSDFRSSLLKVYPLLELDRYRYERLMCPGK